MSGLAILDQLSLLQTIYGKVIIPTAVANELTAEGNEDKRIPAVLDLEWVERQAVQDAALVVTFQNEHNLDQGEAEAIVLAYELQVELLIDERLGRREATRLGLSITGLLGVLITAKVRGLIPTVKPIVDDLIEQASFRVSSQLYGDILKTVNE